MLKTESSDSGALSGMTHHVLYNGLPENQKNQLTNLVGHNWITKLMLSHCSDGTVLKWSVSHLVLFTIVRLLIIIMITDQDTNSNISALTTE